MKHLLLALLVLLPATLAFSKSEEITDLNAALQQASTDQKALFIIYGRETCSNCNALHGYIDHHLLHLTNASFLVAKIDCDDPAQSRLFRSKFKVEGNTLPFVVVSRPDGSQVASRTGYGTAEQFNTFIRDAKKDLK